MTPVKKDASVRVCSDFKVTINPQLEVDEYPLPRIDDIYASLGGGTLFSLIDLHHAYLQMKVEEQSRPFLTMNATRGLYQHQPSGSGLWTRSCKVFQGFSAT